MLKNKFLLFIFYFAKKNSILHNKTWYKLLVLYQVLFTSYKLN